MEEAQAGNLSIPRLHIMWVDDGIRDSAFLPNYRPVPKETRTPQVVHYYPGSGPGLLPAFPTTRQLRPG
jgi:hypothetical protein